MSSKPLDHAVLKWTALGLIIFLVGVIVIAVLRAGGQERVTAPAPTPASSPTPTPTPTPTSTELALPDIEGIPKRGTALLVVVDGDSCWRGYVGSTEIEECGLQKIKLTNVPNQIRAGAQLKRDEEGYRLELYVVHEGEPVAHARASVGGELVELRANLKG